MDEQLDSTNELDQALTDSMYSDIARLMEELRILIQGRPLPQEGEQCLQQYRECLMEEHKNPSMGQAG